MIDDFEDKLREALIASIDEVSQETISLPMPPATDKPDVKSGGQVICSVALGGVCDSTLAIVASGDGVCKLASKILGNEITELNQDSTHVIGEMVMKTAEKISEKLSGSGFNMKVQPVETIDDEAFDSVKQKYMLAIRKYFQNDLLALDSSLMYQMPKEGEEEPPEESDGDAPPEPAVEEPTEEKKEGPKVILEVLEKEEGKEESAQPAAQAVSDELMSEAMKQLEAVIEEVRSSKSSRISIKNEAVEGGESDGAVALQDIDTSTASEESPPTLADQKLAEEESASQAAGEEPPTLASESSSSEEPAKEDAGESPTEEKPVEESSPSEEASDTAAKPPAEEKPEEAPVEEKPAEESSAEEPVKEEESKAEEKEVPTEYTESSPEAEVAKTEEKPVEEPPKEDPPTEDKPAEEPPKESNPDEDKKES